MRIVIWIAVLATLLLLSRYILFKNDDFSYHSLFVHGTGQKKIERRWTRANLRVFATIRIYCGNKVSRADMYKNIGGNIAGFIPLGFLLPFLLWRRAGAGTIGLIVFLISLSFESIQLITGLGVFDVDDLLLNTAGGLIGYCICSLGRRRSNPIRPIVQLNS